MIGLYRDGSSLLHRLPAGAKLLGLLLVGVASPFVRSPLVTASGLLLVLAGYTVARMPLRVLLHLLRPLLLVMVPLAVFQTIVTGWQRAEYDQMGLWPGDEHFRNRYDVLDEYARILKAIGREPNLLELGIFSVMWSANDAITSAGIQLAPGLTLISTASMSLGCTARRASTLRA